MSIIWTKTRVMLLGYELYVNMRDAQLPDHTGLGTRGAKPGEGRCTQAPQARPEVGQRPGKAAPRASAFLANAPRKATAIPISSFMETPRYQCNGTYSTQMSRA